MKKRVTVIALIVLLLIWYGEDRKFYVMTNGQYITLWKTYGNTSFIIPGKYYGIIPHGNFLKTSSTNLISMYAKADRMDTIFFLSSIPCETNNSNPAKNSFADFNKFQNKELGAVLNQELEHRVFKDWVTIQINVEENYARDKNGIQK